MNEKLANQMKEAYPPGTRIELISMDDPWAPVASGTRGTVRMVDDAGTIHMKWDNGRTLGVVPGEDSFRKLTPEEVAAEQADETEDELIGGSQGNRVYDPAGIACTQCATAGGKGAKTGLYLVDLNSDPVMTETARCLVARYDKGISNHRGECSGVLDETMPPIVRIRDKNDVYHQGSIRRLTPQECWRLQGFTDEQFAKVKALGMSDSVLYKMAGNAVSVPVVRAIGEKIIKVYKEDENA